MLEDRTEISSQCTRGQGQEVMEDRTEISGDSRRSVSSRVNAQMGECYL